MQIAWNGPDEWAASLKDYYSRYYVPYSNRPDAPWLDPRNRQPYSYRAPLVPPDWEDQAHQMAARHGYHIETARPPYPFVLRDDTRIVCQSRGLYPIYVYLRDR